jgi:hypothetical protein
VPVFLRCRHDLQGGHLDECHHEPLGARTALQSMPPDRHRVGDWRAGQVTVECGGEVGSGFTVRRPFARMAT